MSDNLAMNPLLDGYCSLCSAGTNPLDRKHRNGCLITKYNKYLEEWQ